MARRPPGQSDDRDRGLDRRAVVVGEDLEVLHQAVEELREPRIRMPVDAHSRLVKALTFPFFIHIRCRIDHPR